MRTQDSITTKINLRRLFMLALWSAIAFTPLAFFFWVIASITWDPRYTVLGFLTALPAAAGAVVSVSWYSNAGIPQKIKMARRRDLEDASDLEKYRAWKQQRLMKELEEREKEEIKRQVEAEASEIAYKGDIYFQNWKGRYVNAFNDELPYQNKALR